MFKRHLQPHEAILVATREIEATEELDSGGVGSTQLSWHPLTKDLHGEELYWACKKAKSAGWLMGDVHSNINGDNLWGLRLNDFGMTKADELSRPKWLGLIGVLFRDLKTAIITGVSAAVGAYVGVAVF